MGVLLLDMTRIKLYLDKGVNSNIRFGDDSTALHIAVDNDYIEMAHLLLTYPETNPNIQDITGCTPLNLAARHGHKDIAQLLIQYNADIDKSDRFHYTPLHTAILNFQKPIVDILLSNGADPNRVDSFGRTPLFLAAKEIPDINVVKRLLDKGADPNFYNVQYTMSLLMGK